MAWLAGWSYRKAVTVSNASADYQTKVLVGESSGATGEEVDCGGHVAADFDDLRFTAADGTTLLDYWIESITGASPNGLATVWVQNNAGADTTLYMYYGGTETAVSNGANTFIVFDNFERGNDGDTIGGDWTEVGEHVHISTEQKYTGTRSAKFVGADALLPYATIPVMKSDNIAIRYRIYKETAVTMIVGHGDGTNLLFCNTTVAEVVQVYDGAAYQPCGSISADEWQLMEFNNFVWASATCDVYENGVRGADDADFSYGSAAYTNQVVIQGDQNTGRDVWIDDFIVRKWTSTEPSFAFGGEETPGWAGGNPLGVAIAGVARINGVALADIVKVNGVA